MRDQRGNKNPSWKGGKPNCLDCNKQLVDYRSKRCGSCAVKIQMKSRTNEKHPRWKGGITSSNDRERKSFRREMQKIVFERDNYICQICGAINCALQVDHIQSWAEYVDQRFSLNNCRTLCMGCHYLLLSISP